MRAKPLVLSMLAFGALAVTANDIEPSKEFYNAYRAGGSISVDGVMSDWVGAPVLADPKIASRLGQEGVPPPAGTTGDFSSGSKGGGGADGNYILFERYAGGTWSGPDDHTSAVQVVYDADNVYFGFVVTDDSHQSSAADPGTAWNGDSVQLMVTDATRTTEFALYNYAVGGTDDAIGEVYVHHERGGAANPDCACDTTAVVRRDTANRKTYYEIKLPAAAVGLTPPLTAGMRFGLGMAINDGENTPGQEGQKGWGGLGAHSIVFQKTPSETALVTLVTNLPSASDLIFLSAINPGIGSFRFRANDLGASQVAPTTASLTIDGQVVTLVPGTKTGGATDFTYTPAAPFVSGSSHTYAIELKDTAGRTITDSGSFTTPAYALLDAANRVTPDTTKPGFIWNVHQVDSTIDLPNTSVRTEQQLAGLLGDNVADPANFGPAASAAAAANPPSAPISFVVPGVINFEQNGADIDVNNPDNFNSLEPAANPRPNDFMPGIPGTTGDTDNIAAEILTVIDFPAAGLYRLIVNSDDGFKTTFGKNPRDAFSPAAGEFSGGRGATDSAFDVYVPAAGAYPMRTTWEEGGGGANIEIMSETGGTKFLLNDTSDAQALKTYQLNSATLPAFVRSVTPAAGQKLLTMPTNLTAVIVDGSTTVTANSGTLKINGTALTGTSTKSGNITTVSAPLTGLQAGVEYTAELTYTDSAGSRTATWKFTTGSFGGNLFVIEAEDFDYSEDGFTGGLSNPKAGEPGLDVNVMPYLGGAYDTLSAVENIDYVNNDALDSDLYRTELDENFENEVNIGTANNVAGGNGAGGTISIGSMDRITYQVTSNYRIGWVGGDWQNYTRNFPANGQGGWWKVYAALSYGLEAGVPPESVTMSGRLERVTSGWGTIDQTVEVLGSFTGPASGGWGNNNLLLMKNAAGGDAVVKLTGTNTVRFNNSSGDFDFLIFTPASPPPPSVATAPVDSVEPDAAVLNWTIQDSDVQANASSVKVFIDGEDVTAKATSTKAGSVTTVALDMTGTTLPSGERNWRITFADNSAPPQTHSAEGTFVVVPFDIPGIFVIEAEDFNYSEDGIAGGLSNPRAAEEGMNVNVMPYFGGAYDALSAVEGIDYNNGDAAADGDIYRTELDELGENEVSLSSDTGGRYTTTRGAFEVTANYRIGWVNGGDWQNYTRNFPTNTYNVWAALSHGNLGPGLLTGSLDLVTSDPTQPSQTVQRLGTFNGAGTGGWGRNELVLMKDTAGETVRLDLGGTDTVRFNLGGGDFDYLLFVPAGDAPVDLRFTRVQRNANGSITVEWTGGGTLEAATSLAGPWNAVAGAGSPYTFTPAAGQQMMFARIRQ